MDKKATKMYAYHLAGMGVEIWDHPDPFEESPHPLRPCARAVAKLACYTYFPKAYHTSPELQEVFYIRPCRNACTSFLEACSVECCDESVQCAFEREREDANGTLFLDTGYVNTDGPSLS